MLLFLKLWEGLKAIEKGLALCRALVFSPRTQQGTKFLQNSIFSTSIDVQVQRTPVEVKTPLYGGRDLNIFKSLKEIQYFPNS